MNRVGELMAAAGIDPRQGPAETAALVVRRFPLRIGAETGAGPEETLERRWCSGLEHFADVLALVTGRPCRWGSAFGLRWPWIEVGGALVAPGLPVRVVAGREEYGPDGAYTLEATNLLREAAGRRNLFLNTEEKAVGGTPDLDLLWFSDTARFLLREGVVEIEDLFSKTRCFIDDNTLDALVVRGLRIDRQVIEGLPRESGKGSATVEVAREQRPLTEAWRDVARFLESKMDVDEATVRGDHAVIKDVRGERVEFVLTSHDSGWALDRRRGRFPYDALELQRAEHHVVLKAVIPEEHDLLSSGVRGRFVFDLNADLGAWLEAGDDGR